MAVDPAAAMTSTTASQYVYPADTPYFSVPFDIQNSDPTAQAPATSYLPPPQIPVVPQTFARTYPVYSVTQYQQAQQLFQWDAQMITPQVLESIKAALASTEVEHKAEAKKKAIPHKAAGQTGRLADWPENDFCLFCGDLRNEVNDDVLTKAFMRFPSFNMARVVRDKRTGKTKGYGFVSFANPSDLAAALKEMNGKYVGKRPIKLRKSRWKDRTDFEALEKLKNHTLKKPKVPKRSILHR